MKVVYPGTPAADAALHPGDIVTRIDGRTADELDAEMLVTKLEGPLSTRLAVHARSPSGAEREVILTLRDLL